MSNSIGLQVKRCSRRSKLPMPMQSLPQPLFVSVKPVQSSQEKQLPSLLLVPKFGYRKDLPRASYAVVHALLIELCASADSELVRNVPYGSAALRITDKEDFTKRSIIKDVDEII